MSKVESNKWKIDELLQVDDLELERMFHAGSPAYRDVCIQDFLSVLPYIKGVTLDRTIESNVSSSRQTSVEELETDTTSGISAASAAELAAGGYIDNGMTVIITGPSGTGKSYFACALGDRVCRNGVKVMYFTMNMIIENLKLVHLEGRETNFFRKLNNQDVLIVDDFGMVKLDGQIQHDFEQIIDDRYNRKTLILASQLPVADWYNVFQSELIAEACLDRLVHKAIKFDLKGESLRKKY